MDPVMEKNKEDKKKIVLEHIAAKCKDPSTPYQPMKDIGAALNNGAELKAKILTGGLANFSYMIYTDDQDSKVFAKLSFSYFQLYPDKVSPLIRTENEYKMMKIFQELAPESVVTPYFCLDIKSEEEDMKCLVTEWSKASEQFGNQFIDGEVDPRTAVSLAKSIAALHCSSVVGNDFNADVLPFVRGMYGQILPSIFDGWVDADPATSRVAKLAQELTKAKLDQIYNGYQERTMAQDNLVHCDFHVFNIMVGNKPDPETLERFAPEGNVVFCDWEMSHVGPAGRDLGPFQAFPYACAVAHAINGNPQCSMNILDFLDSVWNEYDAQLKAHGKADADVRHVYKDSLAFVGVIMAVFSGLGIRMNFLPIDESATDDLEKAKDSVGCIALKAMMLGCGPDDTSHLTLEDLRKKFKQAVLEEMAVYDTASRSRRNRRSSALRASGVRVSDAHLHFTNMDRASMVEGDRRSMTMFNLADIAELNLDESAEEE